MNSFSSHRIILYPLGCAAASVVYYGRVFIQSYFSIYLLCTASEFAIANQISRLRHQGQLEGLLLNWTCARLV